VHDQGHLPVTPNANEGIGRKSARIGGLAWRLKPADDAQQQSTSCGGTGCQNVRRVRLRLRNASLALSAAEKLNRSGTMFNLAAHCCQQTVRLV
jgi:hypothetical protein